MWSKGNLERGFATGDFRMCYRPSGFRACRSKQLDATPILPNQARYHLRYTRRSLTIINESNGDCKPFHNVVQSLKTQKGELQCACARKLIWRNAGRSSSPGSSTALPLIKVVGGSWRPNVRRCGWSWAAARGAFTAQTAQAHPNVLFIALERVADAMVVAMERCAGLGLSNVFFYRRQRGKPPGLLW